MPSCTTCGNHYRISKEYTDPFECQDCLDIIVANTVNEYSENDSVEYDLFHEGCSRTLPKFYEEY